MPPLLLTFLVTSGLYSVLQLDSEQYVNQLGFSGRPVPRIYHVSSLLVCVQAVKVILFLAQNRIIVQYCY